MSYRSMYVKMYVSVYVPGFYIALQCVLTQHSAEQEVHSAGAWSVWCVVYRRPT